MILITKAIVALHNLLMLKNALTNNRYCPRNFVDCDGPSGFEAGEWRRNRANFGGLQPISQSGSNNYSKDAASVRHGYKNFFNNEGAVEWQWELVTQTANPFELFSQ